MTNHTEKNKAYITQTLEYLKENRERLATASCSWCTKPASAFEFFDQRNFVPIQGKVDEQGNQAYAIYGDCCLNDARKVADIKRAFVIDQRGNAGYVPLYSLQSIEEYEEVKQDGGSDVAAPKEVVEANKTPESSKNVSVQKDTATAKVETETVTDNKEEDKGPSLLGILKGKKENKTE